MQTQSHAVLSFRRVELRHQPKMIKLFFFVFATSELLTATAALTAGGKNFEGADHRYIIKP